MNPNLFAYMVLILWVPLSVVAFATMRAPHATLVLLLGAILLLPEHVVFDPPVIPAMGKQTLAALLVLLGAIAVAHKRLAAARPGRGVDLFFVVLIVGSILTAATNGDRLPAGPVTLPALTLYDGFASAARDILLVGIPFFVGRALFRDTEQMVYLFKALAVAGLAYSLLVLFEVRLSPQLHIWTYGFFPHEWIQVFRWGGYRPTVFMSHGLALGMFLFLSAAAATHLARTGRKIGPLPPIVAALYLFVVVLLCKSFGAIVYSCAVIPLLWVLSPKNQLWAATLLAFVVLTYPLTRGMDVFPTDSLVTWTEEVDPERAASLEFRFDNEDALLDRAFERPWFGWGGYGRSSVYDPVSGKTLTVTDGTWIIELSHRGLIGFIGYFGLLLAPLYRAARNLPRIRSARARTSLAALALLVGVSALELLPNAAFNYLPFLLAGSLHGLATGLVPRRVRAAQPGRPGLAFGLQAQR